VLLCILHPDAGIKPVFRDDIIVGKVVEL